ncbi:BrnA antitoxin family protein [Treponema sp.]|uniref:BrnA antitoxin family protein n=1 Tax=Treponema sp. TaxID=166 RepID=UPI003FA310D1
MSTIVTMTLDEVERRQLTEEEKQIIRNAKPTPTDDCPAQSKEELVTFLPWYETHPHFHKPKKTELHIRIDADVLEWFKAQGTGYQTKMNAVLREYAFGSA